MTLETSHFRAIETAERVASVFSVVGACFIITTFLSDSKFRKPINRLVFYAAWGNLFANVGTLIARSGIELGVRTPLCQFQGLLIQWYVASNLFACVDDRVGLTRRARFLPADALWTFAMACNVYLSFFRQYDASQLRSLEWRYLGACYGIPLIPGIVFLFVETGNKGKVYGDAVVCGQGHSLFRVPSRTNHEYSSGAGSPPGGMLFASLSSTDRSGSSFF
jgi:hypothetical protein